MARSAEIQKKDKGLVSQFFFWVAVVFCFLAIYVLSAGPVAKYAWGPGVRPGPVVFWIYAPLHCIGEKSMMARRFMGWYVEEVWGASDEEGSTTGR